MEEYLRYFGTKEDIKAVAQFWYEATTLDDARLYDEDIAALYLQDFDLLADMRLILKDCPQTAKVAWKDFGYFADNYKRTLRNALAWKRGQDAFAKAKAETSKFGACLLCGIRPATDRQSTYSDQRCAQCGIIRRRARMLLDAAENGKEFVWMYTDKSAHWIGTRDTPLFVWRDGASYEEKLNGLVEAGDKVMDAIEKLVGQDLVSESS